MVYDQVGVESRIFTDADLAGIFTEAGVSDLYDGEGVIDYVAVSDHAIDVLGYEVLDATLNGVCDNYFVDVSGKWTRDAVVSLLKTFNFDIDFSDDGVVDQVVFDEFGLVNNGKNTFESE